jgi:ABC-type bacteriocin/lantibiotic exporter with double-glycine peptidase domain
VTGARRAAFTIALACAGTGCVSHLGGGQPVDPARITAEPGWIAAEATPEVRQRSENDCGPAVLAMVAGRWHMPLALGEAAGAVGAPPERGAKLGELRKAARSLGLVAYAIRGDPATITYELRAGRPVIVGLLIPQDRRTAKSHYEVVVAAHPGSNELVSIDPGSGWRVRNLAEFDAEWEAAGRPALIVLGPAADGVVGLR